jgi:hypothetical protein
METNVGVFLPWPTHECELFITCEEWSYMKSQVEFHCKQLQKDIWLHGNTR